MANPRAHAQDLEPRAYANTPLGLNFLIAGYSYGSGGIVADPSVPLTDAKVETHNTLLSYVRSLGVWGTSGKLGVVLPYAWASGTATFAGQPGERDVSGLGDPRFLATVNLYGAPALSLEEFARYKQDVIVGASLRVTVPLGQYDSDKLLNIGTNRWSFKPEIGISKAVERFILELAAGAVFYTQNDDFLGMILEQEPIYSLQGHLLYDLPRNAWGALAVVWYRGGRTTINDVKVDNLQESVRIGGTLALPLDRHHSIKLHGSTDVYSRTGTGYYVLGVAWQYRWGGGF